ncbi:MAG: M3 family oligoendopeptidase [Longicatena sp.]
MQEWSLEQLYKGYDDPAFQNDFKDFDKAIEKCNQLAASLTHDNEVETLEKILSYLEEYKLKEMKLFSYVELRESCDTTDSQTVSYVNQIIQKISGLSKTNAKFNRYIAEVDNLETYISEHKSLQEYSYLLSETKKDAVHLLSNEVEEVLAKMDISGGGAWSSLQSYLTSTLEVEYQGETTTLSQIRNLAYDADSAVRKSAYEAELKAYDKIKDAIAFALNNIKTQVNTECDLRGFASPLDMSLHQSHMQKETLEAMLEAMVEYMPKFQAYLRRKAELLGYQNGLPWFELFAPLGSTNHKYSLEEAHAYLINHFRPFADDLADMIDTAFKDQWIDFYPRKGKVGGAFCSNLPFIKQSRVLTNYDGTIGDIVTLAHELGHAYHGYLIEDHHLLNTDYSMPVAETASTFNENIIMNAAIDEASGEEKIALIENQLQDLAQIICDIYSRFLFEKAVFEKSKKGFMFADELEQMMLDAQKQAYGDGLDPTYLHPYMWVNKDHYYSSDLSFYNFPYAFGGLFARGLVVKYQEEGQPFVDKYRKMLHATTVSSVEDVAKICDIDLRNKNFWKTSLDTCVSRIDEFLALTK